MNPKAWQAAVDALARESGRLAGQLAAGKPMGKGMQARIGALDATGRALAALAPPGVTKDQLHVASYAMDGMATILRGSGKTLGAAMGPHAVASAADLAQWAAGQGFHPVVDVGALQAMSQRMTRALTHDWERLTADSAQRIINGVTEGMVGGLNPREVARRIQGTITETGGMAYSRAMLIAQTEMGDLYDSSRLHTMSTTPEVGGWWWRARPDACAICQIKHGMIHLSNEPTQRHHRCRCIMVPIAGDAPGPPGSYMPGMQRPPEAINSRLPDKLRQAAAGDGFDHRELLALRDNKGWRQSLDLQPPGGPNAWQPGTGYGGKPLHPGAVAQPKPLPLNAAGKPITRADYVPPSTKKPGPDLGQQLDAEFLADMTAKKRAAEAGIKARKYELEHTYGLTGDALRRQMRSGVDSILQGHRNQLAYAKDAIKQTEGSMAARAARLADEARGRYGVPYVENPSNPYTRDLLAEFARLDPKYPGAFGDRGGAIHLPDGPVTRTLPHLKQMKPRGWEEGKTFDDVPGVYDPTFKTLACGHLGDTHGHGSVAMAAHELGHGLDDVLGALSKHPDFQAVYATVEWRSGYFKQPGDAGLSEAFAEVFGLMGVDPAERKLAAHLIAPEGQALRALEVVLRLMDEAMTP